MSERPKFCRLCAKPLRLVAHTFISATTRYADECPDYPRGPWWRRSKMLHSSFEVSAIDLTSIDWPYDPMTGKPFVPASLPVTAERAGFEPADAETSPVFKLGGDDQSGSFQTRRDQSSTLRDSPDASRSLPTSLPVEMEMSPQYPRRTIALGPPFDDGTIPGEEGPTLTDLDEKSALIRSIRSRLPIVAIEHPDLVAEITRAMDAVESAPPPDPVREALEMYADPANWRSDSWNVPAIFHGPESEHYADPTAPARDALAARLREVNR